MFSDLILIFFAVTVCGFIGSCMCMLEIRAEILDTGLSELVCVYEWEEIEAIPSLCFWLDFYLL